jgi:hypothetical protein
MTDVEFTQCLREALLTDPTVKLKEVTYKRF